LTGAARYGESRIRLFSPRSGRLDVVKAIVVQGHDRGEVALMVMSGRWNLVWRLSVELTIRERMRRLQGDRFGGEACTITSPKIITAPLGPVRWRFYDGNGIRDLCQPARWDGSVSRPGQRQARARRAAASFFGRSATRLRW